MARPRSFDDDQVLDSVLEAFWDRGYEATSMADLMAATGLHKASLYNAFGGKEELYLRSLDRYHDSIETRLQQLFDAHAGSEGVEAWMDTLLEMCRGNAGKRGCFAANAVAERANHDPKVRKIVHQHEQRLRRILQTAIESAQADGSLASDTEARDLADLLWTFGKGLRFAARGGEPIRSLESQLLAMKRLVLRAG